MKPTFDIEYLFLNIRAKSTGEEIDLIVRHQMVSTHKVSNTVKEEVKIENVRDCSCDKSTKNHTNNFQLDENWCNYEIHNN